MNKEERELINNFFDRVAGKTSAQAGSVPAVNALPPIDVEANQLITENLQKNPEAAYRITQMAVVQEAALIEAQNHIRQLEWQLQQANQQLQDMQKTSQQRPSGGFLAGLFGGNKQQTRPAQSSQMPPGWGGNASPTSTQQNPYANNNPRMNPPSGASNPTYPPGYQQNMFNRGGNGFLGSALSTAAGVAGGMFAYNALNNLFSGHASTSSFMSDANAATGAADSFAGSDPFAGEGTAVDPGFDAGAGSDSSYDSGWDDTGSDAGWGDSGGDSGTDAGWGDSDAGDGGDWGGGDDSGWGDDSF
ncbi:hypothetical protein COMNV_00970 [Commensalibacter sp. Nvir]|uniref:DUF2076 domain-containing protein n=1 Tax=Commensalibacter sp. Nvir TaxID=3069817 RepID=UPI002D3E879F|nr:hypothetical protein COMNV_00970 [Commensalibacter sp. Nvir]